MRCLDASSARTSMCLTLTIPERMCGMLKPLRTQRLPSRCGCNNVWDCNNQCLSFPLHVFDRVRGNSRRTQCFGMQCNFPLSTVSHETCVAVTSSCCCTFFSIRLLTFHFDRIKKNVACVLCASLVSRCASVISNFHDFIFFLSSSLCKFLLCNSSIAS
jgi:hypothetical protein